MKYEILLGSLAGVIFLASAAHMDVCAQQQLQEQVQQQQRQQLQADEPIFGSQMMTEQERLEYRARMRSATTAAERERVRTLSTMKEWCGARASAASPCRMSLRAREPVAVLAAG